MLPFKRNDYQLILADPPWRQSKGGKKQSRPNSSGTELDYDVISIEEIKNILLEADKHCTDDRVLFLWTIDKYLHESELIMKDIGYRLHARMIWNKVTGIPAAFTIRYGHEYLLWFYKEKLIPVAKEERGKIHSVFTEQCREHSRKPEISYDIINRLYPNLKKLEMFSRCKRTGWDSWGNQVEHFNDKILQPELF